MTLNVVIKGTEGVVLATDSRVTLTSIGGLPATFDNATKLLTVDERLNSHRWMGAVISGAATIGGRTPHSLMPEFERFLPLTRVGVERYASLLHNFFQAQWDALETEGSSASTNFIVAGYDAQDPYGKVFSFRIPDDREPIEQHHDGFGVVWNGQSEILSRIIQGYDSATLSIIQNYLQLNAEQITALRRQLSNQLALGVPYNTIGLQECIDLATFLIRATMTAHNLSMRFHRGVGGEIEVAVITRTDGLRWIQKRELQGER